MKLYKIMYTIFEKHARVAYIYAHSKELAITVFETSIDDLGLSVFDYEIDCVFELNHIDESIINQGDYYEAREDQHNN